MKTGCALLCGLILTSFLAGCARKERFGEHIEPTYYPVIKEEPKADLPKEVLVKFIGTVTAIRPAKPEDRGVVIGSKFHSKYVVDVRVDRILNDKRGLVTLDQTSTFLVESLPRTFGRHKPKIKGTEKERRYRFTVKGEIGNENKYEYIYMFGSQL